MPLVSILSLGLSLGQRSFRISRIGSTFEAFVIEGSGRLIGFFNTMKLDGPFTIHVAKGGNPSSEEGMGQNQPRSSLGRNLRVE